MVNENARVIGSVLDVDYIPSNWKIRPLQGDEVVGACCAIIRDSRMVVVGEDWGGAVHRQSTVVELVVEIPQGDWDTVWFPLAETQLVYDTVDLYHLRDFRRWARNRFKERHETAPEFYSGDDKAELLYAILKEEAYNTVVGHREYVAAKKASYKTSAVTTPATPVVAAAPAFIRPSDEEIEAARAAKKAAATAAKKAKKKAAAL